MNCAVLGFWGWMELPLIAVSETIWFCFSPFFQLTLIICSINHGAAVFKHQLLQFDTVSPIKTYYGNRHSDGNTQAPKTLNMNYKSLLVGTDLLFCLENKISEELLVLINKE